MRQHSSQHSPCWLSAAVGECVCACLCTDVCIRVCIETCVVSVPMKVELTFSRLCHWLDIAESWTMAVKGKSLVCNVSIALWQFSSGKMKIAKMKIAKVRLKRCKQSFCLLLPLSDSAISSYSSGAVTRLKEHIIGWQLSVCNVIRKVTNVPVLPLPWSA